MKICLVGATGHLSYVFAGLALDGDDRIVGIAPGSVGEEVRVLAENEVVTAHAPEFFSDYHDMLDRLAPDLVVVACHFGDHAKVTLAAFARGCHVFSEKPLATENADLAAIKNAYENADVHFSAMHGMRYDPAFYTAHEAVRQGAIGKVRLLNGQKSYRLGKRPDFYRRRASYGGTIPWVGSHAIDWLAWFAPGEFRTVFAAHSSLHNQDLGDLEMSAHCLFTFADEVSGAVSIDYLRPATASTHGDDRLRVAGTEGVIEVRAERVFLINADAEGERELPAVCERQIFADFLKQIRGTGRCLVSAEDAFQVTQACLLARQAADERTWREFPR